MRGVIIYVASYNNDDMQLVFTLFLPDRKLIALVNLASVSGIGPLNITAEPGPSTYTLYRK